MPEPPATGAEFGEFLAETEGQGFQLRVLTNHEISCLPNIVPTALVLRIVVFI